MTGNASQGEPQRHAEGSLKGIQNTVQEAEKCTPDAEVCQLSAKSSQSGSHQPETGRNQVRRYASEGIKYVLQNQVIRMTPVCKERILEEL